jgi:hypothetical protein
MKETNVTPYQDLKSTTTPKTTNLTSIVPTRNFFILYLKVVHVAHYRKSLILEDWIANNSHNKKSKISYKHSYVQLDNTFRCLVEIWIKYNSKTFLLIRGVDFIWRIPGWENLEKPFQLMKSIFCFNIRLQKSWSALMKFSNIFLTHFYQFYSVLEL